MSMTTLLDNSSCKNNDPKDGEADPTAISPGQSYAPHPSEALRLPDQIVEQILSGEPDTSTAPALSRLASMDAKLDTLETFVSLYAQRYSDWISQQISAFDRPGKAAFHLLGKSDPFEELLKNVRELHNQVNTFREVYKSLLNNLDTDQNLSPSSQPLPSAFDLMRELENGEVVDDLAKKISDSIAADIQEVRKLAQGSACDPEMQIGVRLTQHNFKQLRSGLESILSTVDTGMDIAQIAGTASPSLQKTEQPIHTVFEDISKIPQELIPELVQLTAKHQKEPGDKAIEKEGVVIAKHDQAKFEDFILQKGAKLITLRDGDKIKGFALYFEPGNLPPFAEDVPRIYKREAPQAYVHLILLDKEIKGGPSHMMLLNSVLLNLQRTGARIAVGKVESTNKVGMLAHRDHGWVQNPDDRTTVRSPSGRLATFIGVEMAVDPELRKTRRELGRPAIPSRALQEHRDHSEEDQLEDGPKAGLTRKQLKHSLAVAKSPVLIRITGGCGELSLEQWAEARHLFNQAFRGCQCAVIAGGTQMRYRRNGEISAEVRPGVTELVSEIKAHHKNATFGGIVVGKDTNVRDEDLVVINSEKIWNVEKDEYEVGQFATIKHPDLDHYIEVNNSHLPPEQRFAAEYQEAIALAEELHTDSNIHPNGPFKPVLVSYNGGPTTEQEIKSWAEKKWPVILIAGSGRVTDQLIQDKAWREANPSVIVVPKDPALLRQVLKSFGAVAD